MGECGCGELNIIAECVSFGDWIIVLETYTGCRYCVTGIISTVHFYTPKDAADFDLIPTREIKPDQWGIMQISAPIVDQEDLVEASLERLPGIGHYANLQDWLEDNGRELLQKAIYIRQKKNRENTT